MAKIPFRAQDRHLRTRKIRHTLAFKMKSLLFVFLPWLGLAAAFHWKNAPIGRRDFGVASIGLPTTVLLPTQESLAFDGSGSSAYSGRSPQSKAALQKSYKERIAADVKDFVALGGAIQRGEIDTEPWKFFFIPFPRNVPDRVGRTYAALADFIGHRADNGKLEGSTGYLLAATFAKPNKPPDNTPAVKAYNKVAPLFEPIRAASENDDAEKAKKAWETARASLIAYLEAVEMPRSLDDSSYK